MFHVLSTYVMYLVGVSCADIVFIFVPDVFLFGARRCALTVIKALTAASVPLTATNFNGI